MVIFHSYGSLPDGNVENPNMKAYGIIMEVLWDMWLTIWMMTYVDLLVRNLHWVYHVGCIHAR
jgi:hypothetical protein